MTLVVYYLCLIPEDAHTLLTMLPPIKTLTYIKQGAVIG